MKQLWTKSDNFDNLEEKPLILPFPFQSPDKHSAIKETHSLILANSLISRTANEIKTIWLSSKFTGIT